MIAALFVVEGGVYTGLSGVDPWPESRDARLYCGPWSVVAHPPCERWGRYWSGGPSARVRRVKGDDHGCFSAALSAVEAYGGVLEHPEATHAWHAFGLERPPRSGGWVPARRGWTCCVEQGHYGHKARKATWLYVTGARPVDLIWGPSTGVRLEDGFHSTRERYTARAAGVPPVKRLSARERVDTPPPFRDLLLNLAQAPAVLVRLTKTS